jgi:predicted CoA-substrate-specific enzyme activase
METSPMLVAGIDVGTITTKVVLLRDGSVAGSSERPTTTDPEALSRRMIGRLLVTHGYPQGAHCFAVSTGQGRRKITYADENRTEFLALAKGAHHLRPGTRLVVDIGGMGIRIVQLDELGIMMNFTSNDKCSAGTGCFIDTMAYAMGLEHDQLSFMEVDEERAASIHTTCTIFAESEVISLIAKGRDKKEIVAGLYRMVARKTAMLVRGAGMMGAAFIAGGVSRNPGVVKALEEELHAPAFVPPEPHMVQALGAALLPPKGMKAPANFFAPVIEDDGGDRFDVGALDAYHPSAPSVLVKADEGGLTLAEMSEEEFAIAGPAAGAAGGGSQGPTPAKAAVPAQAAPAVPPAAAPVIPSTVPTPSPQSSPAQATVPAASPQGSPAPVAVAAPVNAVPTAAAPAAASPAAASPPAVAPATVAPTAATPAPPSAKPVAKDPNEGGGSA